MVSARRCAICSQPALPGGRLCDPCKAALKRARDTTHSEAVLPPRRPRRRPERGDARAPGRDRQPVPGASALRLPVAPVPPAQRPARDRRYAAAVAALALVALIASGVWVAHVRGAGGEVAPRYAVEERSSAEDSMRLSARVDERRSDPVPVATAASTVPVDPERPMVPAGQARAEPAARGAASRPTPMVAPPEAAPQGRTAIPPPPLEAEPPAVASAGRVDLVRPEPDRWQALADALAACPTAEVIAGTVCRQSARIEHCAGSWGRSPLCPQPVERDHGN